MSEPNTLRLTDPHGLAPGRFCTLINIGHTPEFFALDLRSVTPEGEACLIGRFFLTPQHAKRLALTLSHHVEGFEKEFGEISHQEPDPNDESSN